MKNELYNDSQEIIHDYEFDEHEDEELWGDHYDEHQKYSSRDRKQKKNLRIKNVSHYLESFG